MNPFNTRYIATINFKYIIICINNQTANLNLNHHIQSQVTVKTRRRPALDQNRQPEGANVNFVFEPLKSWPSDIGRMEARDREIIAWSFLGVSMFINIWTTVYILLLRYHNQFHLENCLLIFYIMLGHNLWAIIGRSRCYTEQ